MAVLFDAVGAIVVWLVVFKTSLLGTLTTAPLAQTLGKLTFLDFALLAACFFIMSLVSRLVEKRVFRRRSGS